MTDNRISQTEKSALYTLQLPSRVESMNAVENLIDTLNDQYNFPPDAYANIFTCLSEAANNAIIHGNKEDESKKVFINVEVQDDRRIIFTVADEGDGFEYNNLPDPTAPENLESLSGRGVFIIKQLADQCIFNTKGNEVELHFKL